MHETVVILNNISNGILIKEGGCFNVFIYICLANKECSNACFHEHGLSCNMKQKKCVDFFYE